MTPSSGQLQAKLVRIGSEPVRGEVEERSGRGVEVVNHSLKKQ